MQLSKGLVTNYGGGGGGLQNGRGACEVLPLRKRGGAEQVLAMLKGGGTTSFEVVLTRELEVLAIVMGGGAQKVSTL